MKLLKLGVLCALSTSLAFTVTACSDDDDNNGDGNGEDVCSDEDTTPAAGGAGGAAPAMCELPDAPTNSLSIKGTYNDDFEGTLVFTDTQITQSYEGIGSFTFYLSKVDNDAQYALALNDEATSSSPCAWSRFYWTESEDQLYYCQDVFAASNECAAEDAEFADEADLETGCGGFPWSSLTPAE